MTEARELRALSADDLQRRAGELRDSIFKNELKLRTGSLNSPAERTRSRRELARVLTTLAEKLKASTNTKKA